MDDAVRVRMLQRETDVPQDLNGFVESQLAAAPENRDERLPAHVLHNESDVAAVEASQLVLMNDVGVADACHQARFALEARHCVGVRDVFGGDDLDRDVVPGGAMSREEDGSHTPASQLALDDVVALELGEVDTGIWASCGHLVWRAGAFNPARTAPGGLKQLTGTM